MVDLSGIINSLIFLLIVSYVISQSIYFINNILVDVLILPRKSEVVDVTQTPSSYPTIHILIPLYKEPKPVVERTLDGIDRLDYQNSRISIHLITESDDDMVGGYLAGLLADFDGRSLTVDSVTVDRGVLASFVEEDKWDITGDGIPRTKASAIKYAFRTLALPAEDVVTVFDADTIVPSDTFEIAVAGLESYDIVQAKQTVRNHSEGWLPRLEAMGMAGWCHIIYAKSSKGPYQLLGKAYFINVADLWEIGDWQVDAITEDITLGIDAYSNGYSLGIIDRYVQDICPVEFSAWLRQKRRWVAGPYPYLAHDDFSPLELLRFWTYSATNQLISIVNVVGVPAGIIYFVLSLAGVPLHQSVPLIVITGFNLANWIFYTGKAYQATESGVRFTSSNQKLKYYLASNPLTQLFYSILWAVPIVLSAKDFILGTKTPMEFHVTPKEVTEIRSGSSTGSSKDSSDDAVASTPKTIKIR